MTHLRFDAPLAFYEDQARALPGMALERDPTEEQMRAEPFTNADARIAVARFHDFLDWPSLAEWVRAIEARDPAVYPFECAVEAVIDGDAAALRRLLGENPGLAEARSSRITPFDPPRHEAALLHYLAANGVEGYRQRTPANAVEIAAILLDAGATRTRGPRCTAAVAAC